MEKKWKTVKYLLITCGAIVIIWQFADYLLVEEDLQENTQNSITNESEELKPIPEPLGVEFPKEIPTPNNPCYSLDVPEDVQNKKQELETQIQEVKTRNENVLSVQNVPFEVIRGRENDKLVALTIDTGTGGADGIEGILQIAKHYEIDLTFFLTGCWILENPNLTQLIFAEGHTVANHSLTHANLGLEDDDFATREIKETERIIFDTIGVKPVLFRKPHYAGGDRITEMVGSLGYISVQGYPNFGDTQGWRSTTTAEQVLSLIENRTAPGAIWVMHNLSPADLGAFEDVVRFHLEEGYKLVRVEDILP